MNNLKLITLPLTILVLVVVLITIVQLLLRKFKNRIDDEGKMKSSYSVFFSILFLVGALVVKSAISIILEIIDALLKIHPQNLAVGFLKPASLVIGVSLIWYLVWFYIVKIIFRILYPKTNDEFEMERNSLEYFLAKGIVFFSLILSVSSILEILLRNFVPAIGIPFYR